MIFWYYFQTLRYTLKLTLVVVGLINKIGKFCTVIQRKHTPLGFELRTLYACWTLDYLLVTLVHVLLSDKREPEVKIRPTVVCFENDNTKAYNASLIIIVIISIFNLHQLLLVLILSDIFIWEQCTIWLNRCSIFKKCLLFFYSIDRETAVGPICVFYRAKWIHNKIEVILCGRTISFKF